MDRVRFLFYMTKLGLYSDPVIIKLGIGTPLSFKSPIYIKTYSPFKYVDINNLS